MFQGNCFQHLQNVWISSVTLVLKRYLEYALCNGCCLVPMSPGKVFWCLCKLSKGHCTQFLELHEHLQSTCSCLCSYKSIKWYLPRHCNWRCLWCIDEYSILCQVLELEIIMWGSWQYPDERYYIKLQSVKTIAMLQVLAILHVSVTIPHHWLSDKCSDFS